MAENNIERFIAKANADQMTTPTETNEMEQDQWQDLAPGVDPSAYNPNPLPSNITDTVLSTPPLSSVDTGKIPPLIFQTPTKSDIEDYFAFPGICGLLNLGNTCYMNSGLQCVFNIERIAKYYLNYDIPKPIMKEEHKSKKQRQELNGDSYHENNEEDMETDKETKTKIYKENEIGQEKEKVELTTANTNNISRLCQGQLSVSFSYLMRKLWTGHFSAIAPNNFKTILGFIYSQFNGFRQQDCQEFLVVLLDRLHEEICNYKRETDNTTDNTTTDNTTDNITDNTTVSSVISDTFQGDLKSEVTCSRCGHISTKTDPFMYLSVPIPHAHERQIEIIWSSITRQSTNRKLMKCLVVIPKVSTVLHIKKAICEVLGCVVSPDHVTLAHVKNSYIELILIDTLNTSHVKDNDFVIYGFETNSHNPPINELTSSSIPTTNTNGYTLLTDDTEVNSKPEEKHCDPWTVQPDSEDNMETTPINSENNETTPLINSETDETTPLFTSVPDEVIPPLISNTRVVVMEWHSCSICLEEMVDTDLLVHSSCGGLLCQECLTSSKQHSIKEDGRMPCPVCQKFIIDTKDFVPVANTDDTTDIVRLLQITVLFRQQDSSGNWSLIGHPALINLPQNESVDYYYTTISVLIPAQLTNEAWCLALTDGKGRFCSRCMYSSTQCRGCILSNAMKDVNLKPGDHLCVTFRNLTDDNIIKAGESEIHSSLSDSRWSSSVSLQDCLQLFSQKESLGDNNLWWCPKCQCNQEAIRQLAVSKLPSTVIIHLKRFLFQDAAASKVDTSVSFPHYLSSSCFMDNNTTTTLSDTDLVLTGCVCHFGTLNSGHYTAYSRHPVSSDWHYYNDEIVTEAAPSDKDTSSGYILFYTSKQENSSSIGEYKLPIERGMISVNDEEELLHLEPILRLMKPKPIPLPPPLPSLKRSSSLGAIADGSSIDTAPAPFKHSDNNNFTVNRGVKSFEI